MSVDSAWYPAASPPLAAPASFPAAVIAYDAAAMGIVEHVELAAESSFDQRPATGSVNWQMCVVAVA